MTYTESDCPTFKIARTNGYAISFLKELFPQKEFIQLELIKNNINTSDGILHFYCTFMPIGNGKAIVYKDGFKNTEDYEYLINLFGRDNVFEITQEKMYYVNTNVFSVSPSVVVSEERFTRLNKHLANVWNLTVETISYYEISKMGGC